jgi:phosphoribosylformylglycinamidine synthase subunit PurSL
MIYRVDVYPCPNVCAIDPAGVKLQKQFLAAGVDTGVVSPRRVFFIETPATLQQIKAITYKLLADPVAEHADIYAEPEPIKAGSVIEVHLRPGVMDPVAASTQSALAALGIEVKQVRTGRSYRFANAVDAGSRDAIAKRYLANSVVEQVHLDFHLPIEFPVARAADNTLKHVALTTLSDDELQKLSRNGHLFLNLVEMKAVQSHFKSLGREPTDVELETLAQTWSEHCVHKTLKSAVEVVDESGKPLRSYKNLIKETIFASTMELISKVRSSQFAVGSSDAVTANRKLQTADFCLSVFKDNAGVIAFDDTDAVCFKVETHNRPSAIEPYGGAATGIGGCIRDVMGTGLGARPIANTDVFCVAFPDRDRSSTANSELPTANSLPPGVIHPQRILQRVVDGVRDYGNRMGIPTVNGAVYFDDNYVGNPLVFAGCVGIIPRDKIHKKPQAGDAIVVMGGRTGRDGIHGATFSSAELTSGHADEFSHAVQIGNAITQKQVLDVLMQARDENLFTAITDCGAGGLSSACGEMGADLGAEVELSKVPLKYSGLRYDEIWISEAQERMVLSVPQKNVARLLELSKAENVETTVIGTFGTENKELILRFNGAELMRLGMDFIHDGIPMPTRKAVVGGQRSSVGGDEFNRKSQIANRKSLLESLSHPNVASKHWIIRQYDHEVQGGSVIKPLVGPLEIGPSDASVIRPKLTGSKAVVVACGMKPHVFDPYQMALDSIDEAIRNAVCVGANLERLAILDNFCWPGCHDEVSMGTLVRACEGCRDGALGYGVPFISGKDSLHNQFTDNTTGKVIRIPNTLLISAIGVIDDAAKCITMNFKNAGSTVYRVRAKSSSIADRRALHVAVSQAIAAGKVRACHDVSDGGWLVSVAEMCIASGLGATLVATDLADAFDDVAGAYIIESAAGLAIDGAVVEPLGTVSASPALTFASESASIEEMTRAWRGTLDW